MTQSTPVNVANPSYLEVSKPVARSDTSHALSAWGSPSQDFGQLFARVHAASKGQTFAASAAADLTSSLAARAPREPSVPSNAAMWRNQRFDAQQVARQDNDVAVERLRAADQAQAQSQARAAAHEQAIDRVQRDQRAQDRQDSQVKDDQRQHALASQAMRSNQGQRAVPSQLDASHETQQPSTRTEAASVTQTLASTQPPVSTSDKTLETGKAPETGETPAKQALVQAGLLAAAQQALLAMQQAQQMGEAEPSGDIMSMELAGGMHIITPTQAPSEASLVTFANTQGMSPAAVAMLMGQVKGNTTQGGGLSGQHSAQWMTSGGNTPTAGPDQALKAAIAALGQGTSDGASESPLAALKQPLHAGVQVAAPGSGVLSTAVGGQSLALAQHQGALMGMMGDKAGVGVGTTPTSPLASGLTAPVVAQVTGLQPAAVSSQVAAQMLASGLKADMGNSNTSSALAAQAMALAGVSEDDIDSLLAGRSSADTLRGDTSLAGLDKLAGAVPRALQPMGVALGVPGAAITQRNELYQSIANRLGEAMGARIAGQIAKGQWSMQLTLRPANLGKVDIDLSMRNGELEAKFASSNPLTRELLQDSLPKLREALAQSGTDIASVFVNGDERQKNHGKSTPQQDNTAPAGNGSGLGGNPNDDLSSTATSRPASLGGDGSLNVWV
jgi:flagellar hook-length control protein FliK